MTVKTNLKKYIYIYCTVIHICPGLKLIDSMKNSENYLDGMNVGPGDKHVLCGDFNLSFSCSGVGCID